MENNLSEMYSEWKHEQMLADAWDHEMEQEVLSLSSQEVSSPDWSTWCQQLCS